MKANKSDWEEGAGGDRIGEFRFEYSQYFLDSF
jgi:hypothetical protein